MNEKFLGKEALINQLIATEKILRKALEKQKALRANLEIILNETPLGWLDKKADEAYETLQKKGFFNS